MKKKLKITIPVMRDGYIQWLEPIFTVQGERYRRFGDHGNYTPVKFEPITVSDFLFAFGCSRLLKFSNIGTFCPVVFR